MRASSSMLACLLVACASVPEAQQPAKPSDWVTLVRGSLVEVSAERALYEAPGSDHFFVHVRVENLGSAPVGVDLRKDYDVFYPNQWGASTSVHRGSVDERRFLPLGPIDAAGQAELVAAYRAGVLTSVPAHAAVDYYREFNASGRAAVDAQSSGMPYVLIVFDGRMHATDGHVAERIDAPLADEPREVALPTPVRWARIPANAVVLRHP